MKKWELIGLTLDQLLEQHKQNPESFEYTDKMYPSGQAGGNPMIYWQPKIEVKGGPTVPDPNEALRAVIITHTEFGNQLICYIHSKVIPGTKPTEGKTADASMVDDRTFIKWRSNWRKFCKLRDAIKAHDRAKENDKYLRKLFTVFPGTLDKHLLGD